MSKKSSLLPWDDNLPNEVITTIVWQGISIEIAYYPQFVRTTFKGHVASYIAVTAKQPIPITETGYKSIFFHQAITEVLFSVDEYVLDVLNEYAENAEWKKYWAAQQQLSLF